MITRKIEKKVIDYLRLNFPEIPKNGLVAGQAVASLLFKYLNLEIPTIINDVDFFVLSDKKTSEFIISKCSDNNVDSSIEIGRNSYSGQRFFCNSLNRGYRVVRSINSPLNPIINIIKVECFNYDLKDSESLDPNIIISGFDFNCVAVGVCLDTGVFYYTPAFIKFLGDLTIRVQSSKTPLHTLLRINKKHDELKGTSIDLHFERKLLLSQLSILPYEEKNKIVGIKFWEQHELWSNDIADWFTFSDYFVEHQNVYNRVSFSDIASLYLNNNNEEFEIIKSFFLKDIYQSFSPSQFVHLYNLTENSNAFSKKYKKCILDNISSNPEFFSLIYFKFISLSPLNQLSKKNISHIRKAAKLLTKYPLSALLIVPHKTIGSLLYSIKKFVKLYKENPLSTSLILKTRNLRNLNINKFKNKKKIKLSSFIRKQICNADFHQTNINFNTININKVDLDKNYTKKEIQEVFANKNYKNSYTIINNLNQLADLYLKGNISIESLIKIIPSVYQSASSSSKTSIIQYNKLIWSIDCSGNLISFSINNENEVIQADFYQQNKYSSTIYLSDLIYNYYHTVCKEKDYKLFDLFFIKYCLMNNEINSDGIEYGIEESLSALKLASCNDKDSAF